MEYSVLYECTRYGSSRLVLEIATPLALDNEALDTPYEVHV